MSPLENVGAVIIGRNEGERLSRCIDSLGRLGSIVYVDSGSTDDSVRLAREKGLAVVTLDPGVPFTAARARNEGFWRLRELAPSLRNVQFVDGDSELGANWLATAAAFLDGHADVAVVCGRMRERFPERSVYNMLCDIEWDLPAGATKACGGNAMMRADALAQAGGYRESMRAGEEPELCVRFRAAGWKIWRLDAAMALHDAAMTTWGQWWKRSVRTGYAFAEGAHLHGAYPERHWIRECRRGWIWGLVGPLAIVALSLWDSRALFLLAAYPLQVIRLATTGPRSTREYWWRAFFLVAGKFPEAIGQLRYHAERLAGVALGAGASARKPPTVRE